LKGIVVCRTINLDLSVVLYAGDYNSSQQITLQQIPRIYKENVRNKGAEIWYWLAILSRSNDLCELSKLPVVFEDWLLSSSTVRWRELWALA